jgi:perosamine synthetase
MMLPYSRQSIAEEDIQAVVEVLRGDWLTTGPAVDRFERALADYVGARHAAVVSSGTAALHAAMFALGISPGDEVIVPAMTFAATANCVVYQGGRPVFADVEPSTLLIDPSEVERKISSRTKAIVAVYYAGQPCDYAALQAIAQRHGLALVADACHSLGAATREGRAGRLADLTAFSFHPVKPITTGEGGAITTDDAALAERVRVFRNHGIDRDHRQRTESGTWQYEMRSLGYNYRLSDIQCALGLAQLSRLDARIARRREIADRYDRALARLEGVTPLGVRPGVEHGYHLYVVRIDKRVPGGRDGVFASLRARGIGANVHYRPVHLHSFYRETFGTGPGLCPNAEAAYREILSLPLFPDMADGQVQEVIESLELAVAAERLTIAR